MLHQVQEERLISSLQVPDRAWARSSGIVNPCIIDMVYGHVDRMMVTVVSFFLLRCTAVSMLLFISNCHVDPVYEPIEHNARFVPDKSPDGLLIVGISLDHYHKHFSLIGPPRSVVGDLELDWREDGDTGASQDRSVVRSVRRYCYPWQDFCQKTQPADMTTNAESVVELPPGDYHLWQIISREYVDLGVETRIGTVRVPHAFRFHITSGEIVSLGNFVIDPFSADKPIVSLTRDDLAAQAALKNYLRSDQTPRSSIDQSWSRHHRQYHFLTHRQP